MATNRNTTGLAWRAMLALCVLLFGALAEPVKLLVPQPVTCGMACCEASGVCYCRMAHADGAEASDEVAGSGAQAARLNVPAIAPACPARCAQVPAGFQKHSIAKAATPSVAFVVHVARRLFLRAPHRALSTLIAEAHSPRAPPPPTCLRINHSISNAICS